MGCHSDEGMEGAWQEVLHHFIVVVEGAGCDSHKRVMKLVLISDLTSEAGWGCGDSAEANVR